MVYTDKSVTAPSRRRALGHGGGRQLLGGHAKNLGKDEAVEPVEHAVEERLVNAREASLMLQHHAIQVGECGRVAGGGIALSLEDV